MKIKCLLCNANCSQILNKKNQKLARYGFLDAPEDINDHNKSTGLNLNIVYCEECCFAFNVEFDYNKVNYASDKIIEAGNFSKRYIEFQMQRADMLSSLLRKIPDLVVEIGAGAGIFLKNVNSLRKLAIEPSNESKLIDSEIEVFNDYFSEGKFCLNSDLVISRQVLEHIKDPMSFILEIKKSFNKDDIDDFYIYLEVPNSSNTFKNGRFYDFYYEHCNYFSLESMRRIAKSANMEVIYESADMDGELISMLMKNNRITSLQVIKKINYLESKIHSYIANHIISNKKIIAWGASGNGVQILNSLGIKADLVKYVVDSDKNKQGKYVPGTGQKIISPSEALAINPNVVIVLSQIHKAEIAKTCRSLFGDDVEIYCAD